MNIQPQDTNTTMILDNQSQDQDQDLIEISNWVKVLTTSRDALKAAVQTTDITTRSTFVHQLLEDCNEVHEIMEKKDIYNKTYATHLDREPVPQNKDLSLEQLASLLNIQQLIIFATYRRQENLKVKKGDDWHSFAAAYMIDECDLSESHLFELLKVTWDAICQANIQQAESREGNEHLQSNLDAQETDLLPRITFEPIVKSYSSVVSLKNVICMEQTLFLKTPSLVSASSLNHIGYSLIARMRSSLASPDALKNAPRVLPNKDSNLLRYIYLADHIKQRCLDYSYRVASCLRELLGLAETVVIPDGVLSGLIKFLALEAKINGSKLLCPPIQTKEQESQIHHPSLSDDLKMIEEQKQRNENMMRKIITGNNKDDDAEEKQQEQNQQSVSNETKIWCLEVFGDCKNPASIIRQCHRPGDIVQGMTHGETRRFTRDGFFELREASDDDHHHILLKAHEMTIEKWRGIAMMKDIMGEPAYRGHTLIWAAQSNKLFQRFTFYEDDDYGNDDLGDHRILGTEEGHVAGYEEIE